MANKRDQIRMSDDEVREFLSNAKTVILTSNGRDGFPHSVPMWFFLEDDGTLRITTFRKSQKVVNVRRDPKVMLLAEDGEEYSELRGVMIKAETEIVDDVELAMDTMLRIAGTDPMMTSQDDLEAMKAGVRKVAEKRVVLLCKPVETISFDHRKLGGGF